MRSGGIDLQRALRRAFGAVALGAFAFVLASCGNSSQGGTAEHLTARVVTRSIGGQPGSLDPQRAEHAFSSDVLRDLYEGFTSSTPEGAVIPATSTSWRIEGSGKRYVFQIREDARWSNGDIVTAGDFVRCFRRAVDPSTASGAADLLRSIVNAPEILEGKLR